MQTKLKTDNNRIIIVTDNEATRNDYNNILFSSKAGGNPEPLELAAFPDGHQPRGVTTFPEFSLDFAFDADQGVQKIEAAANEDLPYAVVFLDLQTQPEWNEVDTARQILNVDPQVQIVICSAFKGFTTERILENLGHAKNVVILHKPFEPTEVEMLAVSLTDNWRANDEHSRVTRCQSLSLSHASQMLDKTRQENSRLKNEKNELNLNRLELSNLLRKNWLVLNETEKCGLFALQSVMVARYPQLGREIPRLQAIAQILAERLSVQGPYKTEIEKKFLRDFFHSTPLCDVGKVGIPDSILNKKQILTRNERTLLQQHTVIGFEILNTALKRFPSGRFSYMAADIARHHHERWDGRGYPDGLSSNFIPLPARIVAVAGAFVCLTPEGPGTYQTNLPKVKEIIQMGSETQFDPYIVDAFTSAFPDICEASQNLTTRRAV